MSCAILSGHVFSQPGTCRHTPISSHGHSGQTHRTGVTLITSGRADAKERCLTIRSLIASSRSPLLTLVFACLRRSIESERRTSPLPRAIEVEYTRDELLRKLEQAFGVAEKAKNGSAMAAAVIGMARITGQIIDRREVSQVGAFDHMTDEQLLDEAKKRSAELGIAFDPKLIN